MANAAQVIEALRVQTAKAAKALVLEIDRELRRATPIDTGHARRNWVPSVGAPSETESGDDSAHAAGLAEVLAYKLGDGSMWVANNVPYIQSLNYGHSDQQPAGFVERAIDTALARVQAKYAGTAIDVSSLRGAFAGAVGGTGAGNMAAAYSPFGDD